MSHIKNLLPDPILAALQPYAPPANPWQFAPVCPDHLVEYRWASPMGLTLICHFEHQPEIRGALDFRTGVQLEPDVPEALTLVRAYAAGTDVQELLAFELVDDIEAEALANLKFKGNL